jgi:GT2 family glycosyltransferase
MKPKVVVIIVIWNGVEDTLECLSSLLQDGYPNFEIVIVDNGSTDGSAETLHEKKFPVRILRAAGNMGFTGGNNLGLAEAQRLGARYVFLLNNDTTLEQGAIGALVEAAETTEGLGICAPVMHYFDQPSRIWFAGSRLSLPRAEALHDGSFHPSRSSAPYHVPWVSGCAMLVRMVALEQVGGFDERFFLTWEDVDWCVRMRAEGWFVMVVPKARIFHKCARSGMRLKGIHSYYAVRNSLLLAAKHAGIGYVSALFFVLARHLRGAFRGNSKERREGFHTTMEGLRDHLLGRYGGRPGLSKFLTTGRKAGERKIEKGLEKRGVSANRAEGQES